MSTACDMSTSDGQTDIWSFDGVARLNAWPAAMKYFFPYWASANACRKRNPTLELVTDTVPGVCPWKSISKYPESLAKRGILSGKGASTRSDIRVLCALRRNSEILL